VTKWAVLIGYFQFVHVATMHEYRAVRKLSTVYQQVSTTRALSTVGNRAGLGIAQVCRYFPEPKAREKYTRVYCLAILHDQESNDSLYASQCEN